MDNKEIKESIDKIKSNMHYFDSIISYDYDKEAGDAYEDRIKYYLNKQQKDAVKEVLNLLQGLSWQLALNNTKKVVVDGDPDTIRKHYKNGAPVKIRPCGEEYKDKTYFGILIGDVALSISESIQKDDPNTLHIKRSMYNPAIFIPELKEIVYGCGSWWGEIESEEDLKEVITEDTINNIWYVKMLTALNKEVR